MKFSLVIVTTLSFCFIAAALIWFFAGIGLPYGADGTKDFIQYWAAWRLLTSGQNPYDASVMHQEQMTIGQDPNVTIMMWNPPWVPLLISPVLELPFEAAALCWFLCNMGLIGLVIAVIPSVLGYDVQKPWVYGLGVFFLPIIECLKLGQLSLLHSFGFILFLWCVKYQRYFWGGFAALLMSVKPHIYLILSVPMFFWFHQIGLRKARLFVFGGALSLLLAAIAVSAIEPRAIGWWLQGLKSEELGLGVIPVRLWRTATLTTQLRTLLEPLVGYIPDWPLWVVPFFGLMTTSLAFWSRSCRIDWSAISPVIICVSFVFASYGWFFDQSVLVIAHFAILLAALAKSSVFCMAVELSGLLAIQLAILLLGMQRDSAQHHYTWVPIALLLLIWWQKTWQKSVKNQ